MSETGKCDFKTTEGLCREISTGWSGRVAWLQTWHILGDASRQGFPLWQTVEQPMLAHILLVSPQALVYTLIQAEASFIKRIITSIKNYIGKITSLLFQGGKNLP